MNEEWRPDPEAEARLESIRRATHGVLSMEIRESHKRSLLDVLMWHLTGADGGKYGIRYRSQGVVGEGLPKLRAERRVRHEHVIERKKLIDQLLVHPEDYERTLDSAVGCLVTKEEHNRLAREGRGLDGWARYRSAGIVVYDAATGQKLDLEQIRSR